MDSIVCTNMVFSSTLLRPHIHLLVIASESGNMMLAIFQRHT